MANLGPVYISFRALTNNLGPDLDKALRGSRSSMSRNGEDLGRLFSQGFARGTDTNAFRRVANGLRSMVPEADAAKAAFTSMVRTSYTLGTALTGVLGGISTVVAGLGSLIGAAGGASASIAVLGNGIFALGAGMIASKLALSGVGQALKNLNKQTATAATTGTQTALQAVRDSQAREGAARRVADAERALGRVIEANRDRMIRANEAVIDAQSELTAAIRAGREEIQQIGFEAEDAALAEKRASLELDRAREALAKAQDLPPNSRVRREAELAYEEAELNYRKAQDNARDTAAEQQRLARTGTNGLESVIDARNRLADAEADRAKTARDAMRDEEDAVRNLTEARQDANNVDERQSAAAAPAVAGASAVGPDAWDKGLNKYQRDFVLFLNGLRPKFEELELIAARAFLPKLQIAIQTLMDKAFPTVATGIEIVASAMGDAAITLANYITTSENLAKVAVLFESSGRLIQTLGEAIGRAWGVMLSILVRSAPMAETFFTFVSDELGKFDNWLNNVENNDTITAFFKNAEETAKLFGDIFGNVFRGIGGIISANIGPDSGGWMILEGLRSATSGWGDDPEGLKQYFVDVANNLIPLGGFVRDLVGVFAELGANQAVGEMFSELSEALPALESVLTETVNAAPQFAELVSTIVEISAALTDTGALQIFFGTLNDILSSVLDFVSDPGNKSFMDFWGRIFAYFSAVGLIASGVAFGLKALTGGFLTLLGPVATGVGIFKRFQDALMVKSGFGAVTSALSGLGGSFDDTGRHKDDLIKNLGLFDKKMLDTSSKSNPLVLAMENVGGTFRLAGADAVATTGKVSLASKIMGGLSGVLGSIGGAFAVAGKAILPFLGPIGIVIGVITTVVGLFMLLYNTNAQFKADMDKVWGDLTKTFSDAGQQIMDALQPLIQVFQDLVVQLAPVISMIITSLVPVFTMIISTIADLVATILTALVPVISMLVQALVPVITTIVTALVPVIQILVNVLSFLIQIIAAVIKIVVEVFANVLTFIIEVLTNVITGVLDFISNFGSNWESFWSGVGKFIDDTMKNIGTFFSNALNFVVDLFLNWTLFGLIISNFDNISRFIGDVLRNIQGFFDAAFKFIDQWVIQPFMRGLDAMGRYFDQVGKGMQIVWEAFKVALDVVWRWIDDNIFRVFREAFENVGKVFELVGLAMAAEWQRLQDLLNAGFQFIDTYVFSPIRNAIDLVQKAFEWAVDGIGTAMDRLRKAAADPVNFVIDTVYNNGIRSFWNTIADNLNLDKGLRLDKVPTVAFASGGVLPGYTPGRDVHDFYSRTAGRLRLSGGEAIMRPEWTRAVGGPRAVARMNAAAIRGQAFASGGVFNGGGMPTQSFASGGVFDFLNFLGDAAEKAVQVIGTIPEFFADPKAATKKYLVDGIISPLMGGQGGGKLNDLLGSIPAKAVSSIADVLGNFFSSQGDNPGAGMPANNMGWRAMWDIVRTNLPGAVMTSNYRPGSMTVNGTPSMHGAGRAIDVIPATMATFDKLRQLFPNARELIYTPAGKKQLYNGNGFDGWSAAVKAQHYNHVHLAMAKGGVVSPSPNGTIARIAEAGQAERVEPLDKNGISERDKAWAREFGAGQATNVTVNITVERLDHNDIDEFAEQISHIITKNMRKGH